LYDAIAVPDGTDAVAALMKDGHALEFIKETYRHCKPMLLMGSACSLLEKACIVPALPNGERDPGIIGIGESEVRIATDALIAALLQHRVLARETDPPTV
jgi:catalase